MVAALALGAAVSLGAAACGGDSTVATPTSAQTEEDSAAATTAAQEPRSMATSLMTSASDKDFAATVGALKTAVSDNGMMILGELDQASALKATGLNLAGAHTFFVGNPSIGKMFFERTAEIGTVIPLQMLVWAGNDGKAHVSYFDPKPLFEAVDPMLADGGQKMSDAAAMISSAATGAGGGESGTAQPAELRTVDSQAGFEDTVNALKRSASDNGMMILGDLDQAAALKATGLNLSGAHTFFVGNPSVGKMFFEQTPAIGAVLPLRILVWAGNDGKAHVSYFDPKPLFQAVDPSLAEGGQKMSDAAAMVAGAVT
ncbi:MAG TPA: DUF302 domain-containing protein [Mycobacterium sp.]